MATEAGTVGVGVGTQEWEEEEEQDEVKVKEEVKVKVERKDGAWFGGKKGKKGEAFVSPVEKVSPHKNQENVFQRRGR